MIDRRGRAKRVTLGADKAYDVTQFVDDLSDSRLLRISRSTDI